MKLDKFSNPIFNETDVFDILYQNNTEVLSQLTVDLTQELAKLENTAEFKFKDNSSIDKFQTMEEFDKSSQQNWFMPEFYYSFNIKEYCISKCTSQQQINRVIEEYNQFENLEMIKMLQWCKYFVDTCVDKNILWGVGRGSSVASYILYLIGVHRIDSIKYGLDWNEFIR